MDEECLKFLFDKTVTTNVAAKADEMENANEISADYADELDADEIASTDDADDEN